MQTATTLVVLASLYYVASALVVHRPPVCPNVTCHNCARIPTAQCKVVRCKARYSVTLNHGRGPTYDVTRFCNTTVTFADSTHVPYKPLTVVNEMSHDDVMIERDDGVTYENEVDVMSESDDVTSENGAEALSESDDVTSENEADVMSESVTSENEGDIMSESDDDVTSENEADVMSTPTPPVPTKRICAIRCLRNPCDTKCARYPNAYCVQKPCSCEAKYYILTKHRHLADVTKYCNSTRVPYKPLTASDDMSHDDDVMSENDVTTDNEADVMSESDDVTSENEADVMSESDIVTNENEVDVMSESVTSDNEGDIMSESDDDVTSENEADVMSTPTPPVPTKRICLAKCSRNPCDTKCARFPKAYCVQKPCSCEAKYYIFIKHHHLAGVTKYCNSTHKPITASIGVYEMSRDDVMSEGDDGVANENEADVMSESDDDGVTNETEADVMSESDDDGVTNENEADIISKNDEVMHRADMMKNGLEFEELLHERSDEKK